MVRRSRTLWGITMAHAFHDLIPLYLQHYDQPPAPYSPNHCSGHRPGSREGHHVVWLLNILIRFDGTSFLPLRRRGRFFHQAEVQAMLVSQDHTGKVWIGRLRIWRHELWCYADGSFQSVQVDLGGWLTQNSVRSGRSDVVLYLRWRALSGQ